MCSIMGFTSCASISEEEIKIYFDRTKSRGPDMSRMEKAGKGMLCFHRLAIMGLHEEGMQPFHLDGALAGAGGEVAVGAYTPVMLVLFPDLSHSSALYGHRDG